MPRQMIDCIPLIAIILMLSMLRIRERLQSKRERDLLRRGIKICGQVRFVQYEWAFRRSLNRYYELYAEFEYDGKTHYALKKCRHKPRYQAGDPIGICFDPDDPDENMILDFPDENVNP